MKIILFSTWRKAILRVWIFVAAMLAIGYLIKGKAIFTIQNIYDSTGIFNRFPNFTIFYVSFFLIYFIYLHFSLIQSKGSYLEISDGKVLKLKKYAGMASDYNFAEAHWQTEWRSTLVVPSKSGKNLKIATSLVRGSRDDIRKAVRDYGNTLPQTPPLTPAPAQR